LYETPLNIRVFFNYVLVLIEQNVNTLCLKIVILHKGRVQQKNKKNGRGLNLLDPPTPSLAVKKKIVTINKLFETIKLV
jgi:hypothetical protein